MNFLTRSSIVRNCLICYITLLSNQAFTQSAAPINVMTYNIRYKNTIDGINGWEYRKDKVAGLILYHQADIVGVQEADTDQLTDMKARMPGYEWYGIESDDDGNGEYTAIFYRTARLALKESGTFWLSEHPNERGSKSWDSFYARIVSWCKFSDKQTGIEFFFFNTHFDHRGRIAREKSAGVIQQQVSLIAQNAPVIITGDFNTPPSSVPYQKLTQSNALNDALFLSSAPHYGPVKTSSGFSVCEKPIRARIDYIFVNKKIHVLRHATITDQEEGRYYSDHLPVMAAIKMSR